jgi:hypothetical protein
VSLVTLLASIEPLNGTDRRGWRLKAVQRVDYVLARDCDHVVVRKVGNRSDAGYQQN